MAQCKDKLLTKPFFKHDYYAAEDPKVEALRENYGAEGYAVFFLTIEYLYRQEGKPVTSVLGVKAIADRLRMTRERVREILDFASSADCEELFVKTPQGYISNRVTDSFLEAEMEYQGFIKKKSEAGKKSGEARRNKAEQE